MASHNKGNHSNDTFIFQVQLMAATFLGVVIAVTLMTITLVSCVISVITTIFPRISIGHSNKFLVLGTLSTQLDKNSWK